MPLRDIYFIVADGQAKGVITAFLARDKCHLSIGTRPIAFDPEKDLLDVATNDPGVFINAPSLSRSVLTTHRNLVVLLDEQWDNKKTPGADNITAKLSDQLIKNGWDQDRFAVIVISPELENWIWQDNPELADIFKFRNIQNFSSIGQYLSDQNKWNHVTGKPIQPKETLNDLCRRAGSRPDRRSFELVVSRVNVSRCKDASFQTLLSRLRYWFPNCESRI